MKQFDVDIFVKKLITIVLIVSSFALYPIMPSGFRCLIRAFFCSSNAFVGVKLLYARRFCHICSTFFVFLQLYPVIELLAKS